MASFDLGGCNYADAMFQTADSQLGVAVSHLSFSRIIQAQGLGLVVVDRAD